MSNSISGYISGYLVSSSNNTNSFWYASSRAVIGLDFGGNAAAVMTMAKMADEVAGTWVLVSIDEVESACAPIVEVDEAKTWLRHPRRRD